MLNPLIIVVGVFPVIVPGLIVQLPAGRPDKTTLPVAVIHDGCVIAPTAGADGVTGCALTVTLTGAEIQVLSVLLLTSMVCEPAFNPVKLVPDW